MSDQNPFEGEQTVAIDENTQNVDESTEAFDDVETVEPTDEDVEVVPATDTPTESKPTEAKAPARPPKPEGYITPVEFAHKITEKLRTDGTMNKDQSFPPQQVYSWVKQGKSPSAKNPLKSYSEGGRENLLKEDEAWAWYNAKNERKAAADKAKQDKAAADAEKAKNAPATAPVTEVEAPSEPVAEVE